jgi:nucleolar protein 56
MHNRYIYSNLIGTFVFNEHFKIISKVLFRNSEEYRNRERYEKQFVKKYKQLKTPEGKEVVRILENFKDNKYFNDFYKRNLDLTKQRIKESVTPDLLVIHAIKDITGIDRAVNILVKNLRDWYSLYNPEMSENVKEHESFVRLVLEGKKRESKMGSNLSKRDLEPIMSLAKQVSGLYLFRKKQEQYLDKLMKETCPNLTLIAGSLTGAKLIEIAGSLKHLAEMPSSTVQLLGAEEALFRHLKTGSRCPKYGVIYAHELIQRTKKEDQGKAARALADKITIAGRVDYFKGEFIGDKLKKELEERFK